MSFTTSELQESEVKIMVTIKKSRADHGLIDGGVVNDPKKMNKYFRVLLIGGITGSY